MLVQSRCRTMLQGIALHHRWQPMSSKCKTCKQNLHQEAMYCQGCAYQKGICAMCALRPHCCHWLKLRYMPRLMFQRISTPDPDWFRLSSVNISSHGCIPILGTLLSRRVPACDLETFYNRLSCQLLITNTLHARAQVWQDDFGHHRVQAVSCIIYPRPDALTASL